MRCRGIALNTQITTTSNTTMDNTDLTHCRQSYNYEYSAWLERIFFPAVQFYFLYNDHIKHYHSTAVTAVAAFILDQQNKINKKRSTKKINNNNGQPLPSCEKLLVPEAVIIFHCKLYFSCNNFLVCCGTRLMEIITVIKSVSCELYKDLSCTKQLPISHIMN